MTALNTNNNVIKHWYLPLIIGFIFIIIAATIIAAPLATLATLGMFYFGALMLSGIFETIFGIMNIKSYQFWWMNVITGLADIIIGYILFSSSADLINANVLLPTYFGIIFIIRSISIILWGLNLKQRFYKAGMNYILYGFIIFLLGIILIIKPMSGSILLMNILAFFNFIVGIFLIIIGLKLNKVNRHFRDRS